MQAGKVREEKPQEEDGVAKKNKTMKKKKSPCWKGYKRKVGTKAYTKGSCVKVKKRKK